VSGHSKWATTKHKKAIIDSRRAKSFAKLIKNIEVAAKIGGADMSGNPTLVDAVQKAKKTSVPNDNIDRAVKTTITQRIQTEVRGIRFFYKSGMLFIKLPSGRLLSYVKPRIGENQYGGESVTYEGVGSTKKWERIESYGPKFVENIVQAVSRDILAHALKTLSYCQIVGHVHDEVIIECSPEASLDAICEQMGRTPPWIPGIELRADGYQCPFYQKQ
jgi:DNA polymerase